jgi:hypothetical protein
MFKKKIMSKIRNFMSGHQTIMTVGFTLVLVAIITAIEGLYSPHEALARSVRHAVTSPTLPLPPP